MTKLQIVKVGSVLLLGTLTLASYQNCAPNKYSFADSVYSSLSADNVDHFETLEDTDLKAKPRSVSSVRESTAKFEVVSSPLNGKIVSINTSTGEFVYRPNKDYFGEDSFETAETGSNAFKAMVRSIKITVIPENDVPWIVTDMVSADVNAVDSPLVIEAKDVEDPSPSVELSLDKQVSQVSSRSGTIKRTAAGLSYTPGPNFRGIDEVELTAVDSEGKWSTKKIKINVGNPFRGTEPALAARGVSCLMCHANLRSNLIVDFRHGDKHFFNAHATTNRRPHSIFAHHYSIDNTNKVVGETSWYTARFSNGAGVIVPKADLPYDLAATFPDWSAERTSPVWTAKTVKSHIEALEASKTDPTKIAAHVTEKSKLYIGSPTASHIRARGQIGAGKPLAYWKNSASSPDLAGFGLNAAGGYHVNGDETVCDGDLFVEGDVFLNDLKLRTIEGCRIHATGAVFLQKGVSYLPVGSEDTKLSNLQLVSPRYISMGVGTSHCETDSSGWYFKNNLPNPLQKRLSYVGNGGNGYITRNIDFEGSYEKTSTSRTNEMNELLAIAGRLTGLEDATCHKREVHFERLMLVAPYVSSRYTGNFKGVIIAEVPLFALSKFSFEFDPVFRSVPVLPLIDSKTYLEVE